jgi:hypothetical protein
VSESGSAAAGRGSERVTFEGATSLTSKTGTSALPLAFAVKVSPPTIGSTGEVERVDAGGEGGGLDTALDEPLPVLCVCVA